MKRSRCFVALLRLLVFVATILRCQVRSADEALRKLNERRIKLNQIPLR